MPTSAFVMENERCLSAGRIRGYCSYTTVPPRTTTKPSTEPPKTNSWSVTSRPSFFSTTKRPIDGSRATGSASTGPPRRTTATGNTCERFR